MVWEPGVMWREKRMFAITVQGDVREGLQGATLTHALLPGLREIEARWHAAGDTAYRIDVAGAVEESSKGSDAIVAGVPVMLFLDRKSTRLNSSHSQISYAVFCLKKKKS